MIAQRLRTDGHPGRGRRHPGRSIAAARCLMDFGLRPTGQDGATAGREPCTRRRTGPQGRPVQTSSSFEKGRIVSAFINFQVQPGLCSCERSASLGRCGLCLLPEPIKGICTSNPAVGSVEGRRSLQPAADEVLSEFLGWRPTSRKLTSSRISPRGIAGNETKIRRNAHVLRITEETRPESEPDRHELLGEPTNMCLGISSA